VPQAGVLWVLELRATGGDDPARVVKDILAICVSDTRSTTEIEPQNDSRRKLVAWARRGQGRSALPTLIIRDESRPVAVGVDDDTLSEPIPAT